jgi:non-canonical (house-cleaning) NTP pyrophosphatase
MANELMLKAERVSDLVRDQQTKAIPERPLAVPEIGVVPVWRSERVEQQPIGLQSPEAGAMARVEVPMPRAKVC